MMTVSPLRIERIKRGKTQIDLWVQTGIPQWRISLIERGIPPRPDEARKLAEALQVSPVEIFNKECAA
jgi:transcriptional regulator with XRE-family HTH domain